MKKLLALTLALLMLVSFAACGGDGGKEDPPAEGFNRINVDKDKRVCTMVVTGMKMGKEVYTEGEDISVTVSWTGDYADDSWIGIVPADIEHGDELLNDEHDLYYEYFADTKSGHTFTFNILELEPGKYTMRINETDGGGFELAWCEFTVKAGETDPDPDPTPDPDPVPDPQPTDVPEGYGKYVNQGAVIYYPTDSYQESMFGGIEGTDNGIPWIKVSISGTAFSEQKALLKDENGSSSNFSLEEITVGTYDALKCIYSDSGSHFMVVVIDTTYLNDEFWAAVTIKVDLPQSRGDLDFFNDEALWEIINSFYFDSSLKYSF